MRMNIQRILAATILVCVGLVPAYADPLEDADYEVLDTREEDDLVRMDMRGPDGNEFELRSRDGELTETQVNTLDVIRPTVFGLEQVDVDTMTVFFDGERAEILVVPDRLEYDGQDILPYVPSGLQFRFNQVLEYNFRVRVDEYFLRFQGQYVEEEQFMSRLADAVNDPVGFLESQRPELIAQRIEELEATVSELEEQLVAEQERQGERIDDNSEAISENADSISENAENLETSETDISSLEEDLRETVENVADIRQDDSELEDAVTDLRSAVLAFNNRTFFGRVRPLEPEIVERIVEIRREEPGIEVSEIRDRLSEEGLSASGNEVEIVLAVYFSQFE